MEVFILISELDDHPSNILGVYSRVEDAQEVAEAFAGEAVFYEQGADLILDTEWGSRYRIHKEILNAKTVL